MRPAPVRRARRRRAGVVDQVDDRTSAGREWRGPAGIVTTALGMSRGFLPPTINQREADPDCDLDYIPNTGRAARPVAALCNCLGFGSKNSAIVLGAV